jgi:hypothetical protein
MLHCVDIYAVLSVFRPRGVPGLTSKIVVACPSPDELARDGTQRGGDRGSCYPAPEGCACSRGYKHSWSVPNPLGLKCDTITSPRRLVNTFIHQMITDLLKRDKPIKVANNFKSWSTTRDISSEWGWSSPIYAAKQISGPTATGKVGNSRNSYPISFFWKKNK